MANLEEKRARLELNNQRSKKRKKIVLTSLFGVLILGIATIVLSTQESIPGFDDKYSIGRSMKYKDNVKIEMAEITPEIDNGQIKIPLASLEENSIIYAMVDPDREIGNGQTGLPLMSYLTPAGRVMVASSFCEPCYSRKFHIEGDVLVCNVCSTRWALADLTGLGGGCVKYPPQEIKYSVDETSKEIIVNETDLKNWKPRDYDASTTSNM